MYKNLDHLKSELNIVDVVNQHVNLKLQGTRYVGLCPFHEEKTPSFYVTPTLGIFKCFGCGVSGDAIAFEMKIGNKSFPETIEYLSRIFNLKLEKSDSGEWNESAYHRKEKLYLTNAAALDYWQQQFPTDKSGENIQLDERSFTANAVNHFGITVAPNADMFCGVNAGLWPDNAGLIESGLIKDYNGKMLDFFRNRIIFPLRTESGKIAGFSGRIMGGNAGKIPKYLNSPENEVFKKSQLLFGLYENKAAIKASKEVIIVEGYTDVLRLWESEITNVVAICGTAMTAFHASILKKYADKVTLLFDGDEAGVRATGKAVNILENAGLFVRICPLPDGHDPESLVRECGGKHLHERLNSGCSDAIIWLVGQEMRGINDGLDKQRIVDFCRKYFANSPHSALVDDWAEKCSELLGLDKTIFLPEKTRENPQQSEGIVIQGNCYYYPGKKGHLRMVSNFIMRPVHRIISRNETMWILELCNYQQIKGLIRFNGRSLNSPEQFRQTIEQSGNFIFHGNMADLNLLKSIVFADIPDCLEIDQLGWQRNHRFWAWSNGISKGNQFYPCDSSGIIELDNKSFLIKAAFDSPKSGRSEEGDEQIFRYESGNTQFAQWADLIAHTYTDHENGYLVVLYYLASIFRDVVYNDLRFFPHLFACGIKGSGKTHIALSLGKMFGEPQKQMMLDSGTEIGMGRKASKFSNTIVWFDEYKNSIPSRRIQFLKGLYDGAGHIRGEYSNDTRTNEVTVKSGVFITGQELPVADPALFSRVILLLTIKTKFSKESKKIYNELQRLEKSTGLSHITAWISGFYSVVEQNFSPKFDRIFLWLQDIVKKENSMLCIEDRVINNYAVLLTIGTLLKEHIGITDLFMENAKKALVKSMTTLQNLLHGTDERAEFWDQIKFLFEDDKLKNDDLFCETTKKITLDKPDAKSVRIDFDTPKTLLFLRPSRVFAMYMISYRQQHGRNPLPKLTLDFYMKSQPSYIGYCTSKRLPNGGVSSCLVFDYEATGLRLFDYQDKPGEKGE